MCPFGYSNSTKLRSFWKRLSKTRKKKGLLFNVPCPGNIKSSRNNGGTSGFRKQKEGKAILSPQREIDKGDGEAKGRKRPDTTKP